MSKPGQGAERPPRAPVFGVKAAPGGARWALVDERGEAEAEAGEFLSALGARGLSDNTLRAYAFDLAVLYRWLTGVGKSLQDLTHADLLEFIGEQRRGGAAPRTINRRLTSTRMLYRFCTDQEVPRGRGTSLPVPYYRGRGKERQLGLHQLPRQRRVQLRVQVPRTLVEPLRPEQVGLILESFRRYRDLGVVQLMLLCGLRSAEVLSLTLFDVSFEEGQVRVRGKGGKERMLPLPEVVVETLRGYLRLERPRRCGTEALFVVLQGSRRGQPMTPAGLRSLFRHRRLRPAIGNANPHRFRHTFGADMARAGVRLAVLQKMMGHDHVATTLQYINLSMADVAAEFRRAMAEIQRRYDKR